MSRADALPRAGVAATEARGAVETAPAPTAGYLGAWVNEKGVLMTDERYDVVVIGAGQAGLAIGHFLGEQGRRFMILEAADSVGSAWRSRWDSLVLFTPRRYDALPGLAFPGDPDGYPTRDEVVAYLERYAEHFQLPIALSSPVRSLTREGDAFVLEADERRILADQVVVATGPFQVPNVPALAGGPLRRGLPDAQHRVPPTGGCPRGPRARGRRRQHRLPDRERACRDPRGASRDRLPAEAAAAAPARPRPLLVADEARPALEDGRVAAGSTTAGPRHPDRLESARSEAPRRPGSAARRPRRRPHDRLRRRHASWRSTP